jgi:protein-disulfide isomerase/uncharacterized membrane protein
MSPYVRLCGAVLLIICAASALTLVLEHLGAMALPGCGAGSPCARATASVWGKVPGLQWPVSFVGLAFYLGLLTAWLASREGPAGLTRLLVRLGGVVTLVYLGVVVVERLWCPYCLAAHVAFLAFWGVAEWTPLAAGGRTRPAVAGVGVFAVVTLVLVPVLMAQRARIERRAEQELIESTDRIVADVRNTDLDHESADANAVAADPGTNAPPAAQTVASAPSVESAAGFTGRYRLGPERAAIRIVMFTDYQCPRCRVIEKLAMRVAERDDVSLSVKHFPLCTDCNPHTSANPHPNACWAARAAEAAGILYGNDAFWRMHRWLFERGGAFTDDKLRQGLEELGFDGSEFLRTMQGPETLARVQADIEEGLELGLHFTPMIFINGRELRGWHAQRGLVRAVERLAAENLPPATAAADHPPSAEVKYIEDWRAQPVRSIRPAANPRWLGPDDAKVEVVLFGDFQSKVTSEADALMREAAAEGKIRYQFRYYPFDQACNPHVSRTYYAKGCRAAAAAEAAMLLGGTQAAWAMHAWLMEHRETFDDDVLRRDAPSLGLDAEALLGALESQPVRDAIARDVEIGKELSIHSIPSIYVNGKNVPRWRRDGRPVVLQMIEEAAEN